MSYDEYGGRVYRDGVRIRSREDAPICVQWSCHAVLGDGPVKLGLYKQADVFVFLDGKKLDVLDLLVDPQAQVVGIDIAYTVLAVDFDSQANDR